MRTVWEYLAVHFTYQGRGLTFEFDTLSVDGKTGTQWTNTRGRTARTLPDFLELVGEDGWELVSHTVLFSLVPLHYMTFKRPKSA